MDDRNSSSPLRSGRGRGGLRRNAVEEDGGARVCTGKSCQSFMAGVIADCVALCCCPCAVVNFFVLTVFKLPWAVARKWVLRRKERRRMLEGTKDIGGITDNGVLEIVVSATAVEEAEDYEVWLKLAEIGHLGFGRVSSARINFHSKGD